MCSEKHRISRDDVVVGRILGEGFFGEVHDGVYKSPVSLSKYHHKSTEPYTYIHTFILPVINDRGSTIKGIWESVRSKNVQEEKYLK